MINKYKENYLMSYSNNLCENTDISPDFECFNKNVGRMVTIFTQSGGCSGSGFTGLLVYANHDFIKLITSLPAAPPDPFGMGENINVCCRRDHDRDRRRCCREFGTVIIIPIKKIVAFVFNEV
jgi:hypothetical protein